MTALTSKQVLDAFDNGLREAAEAVEREEHANVNQRNLEALSKSYDKFLSSYEALSLERASASRLFDFSLVSAGLAVGSALGVVSLVHETLDNAPISASSVAIAVLCVASMVVAAALGYKSLTEGSRRREQFERDKANLVDMTERLICLSYGARKDEPAMSVSRGGTAVRRVEHFPAA